MTINFDALRRDIGVVFMGGQPQELTDVKKHNMGMDSDLVTSPNSAIPALFNTFVDPKTIDVLVAPMRMAEVYPEIKKGDWVTSSAVFPMLESTGETTTYGDFNENGISGVNVNFPARQPYHYQTVIRVGEKEIEQYGAAMIDLVSRKQMAAVLTLNKFQNKTYVYGVGGLQNYGAINDPSLLPSITDTGWTTKDGEGVYKSVQSLYVQLVKQTGGLIERTEKMTLILSPEMEAELTKTNTYNVNVSDQLTKNFPNLKVVSVPEYATAAGQLVQLIVDEYEGQATADLGFTEKLRVHPMIQLKSGFEQKRSQGSYGAIIYRPLFIANMLVS